MEPIGVLLESGKKRTFASAVAWPGWSRSGRDPEAALQAMVDYGPRYALVVQNTGLNFLPPADRSGLVVIETLVGDATTDFGAPGTIAEADKEPFDPAELERDTTLLQACWMAFDRAIAEASGKELRTGPRGGGRDLDKIVEHVTGADEAYLRRLAWKAPKTDPEDQGEALRLTRAAILSALENAAAGNLPEQGPRGGKIWPPRYFVRRVAWHTLDHAWEIEDRKID